MFPNLGTEARKFGEMTSVRGIPRIIKSKTRALFFIWLLGVATCGGLMLWQLTVVMTRFFSYPTNTLLVESTLGDNPAFPDIAVCSNDPLVHEMEMPVPFLTYYYALTDQLNRSDFQLNLDKNLGKKYNTSIENQGDPIKFLRTASAYFNNFPFVHSNMADHNAHSPIIACNYINWDYSTNPFDCVGKVEEFWNPDYYKCYKIAVARSLRQKVRGLTAIVYVNQQISSQLTTYDLSLRNSHGNGIRGMIYTPDSAANLKLGGSSPPGTEMTISLNQVKRVRLPEPYSTCTNQSMLDTKYGDSFGYSRDYCIDVCLQQQYINKCRCISSARLFTTYQADQVNTTSCGNTSIINSTHFSTFWQGFGQLLCVNSLVLNTTVCEKECHVPCMEYTYIETASATTWPSISSQLAFYKTYIQGNSRFGNTLDEYGSLLKLLNSGLPSENVTRQVAERLNQMRLISDNFFQLNVQFLSATYAIQKDSASFASDALGAQLGGVLSMWLGVTAMFVFEVCEFIIVLITTSWDSKKKKSASSNTSVDGTQL